MNSALALIIGIAALGQLPPVDTEMLETEGTEITAGRVRNLYPLEALWTSIKGNPEGLAIDLTHITQLLDETTIDPANVYGVARMGPYPFEADEAKFAYKRFRHTASISGGKGLLEVGNYFRDKYNANGWTDRGQVCVRLELKLVQDGADRDLGTYDTFAAFRKHDTGYEKLPTIVEGPLVHLVRSEDPSTAAVSFITDQAVAATITLDDDRIFREFNPTQEHTIQLTGLGPDTEYRYSIAGDGLQTREYRLRTAPPAGEGTATIAYTGDSREGAGGGMENYMGINYPGLNALFSIAYRKEADLFLMGGDLVNGYTTKKADFLAQLHAWKQAAKGFWAERPVYPALGNHEALLKSFKVGDAYFSLDAWPYDSASAEASFAEAFVNPANGPVPSDPARPPYRENVYSLQYGPVKIIAFNNNYWWSGAPAAVGGCPEGYIFDDQLDWIGKELEAATSDASVRYVLLYAQEPVFPNGGHVGDAMWYRGNNNVRAYTFRNGAAQPEEKGIIDVRNAFVRMVANCPKAAAVLTSDEHAYHRVRIGPSVPIGDPAKDDRDGDGIIAEAYEPCSPLTDLPNDVWYITSGGGGAPFYSEEPAPWNEYWKIHGRRHGGEVSDNYFYSSQQNIMIFHADEGGISLRVFTPHGELLDNIADLMAIKE